MFFLFFHWRQFAVFPAVNPVVKAIAGSVGRHWLGAFCGLVLGKWIAPAESAQIIPLLTNDMVANGLIALGAAVIPFSLSIWSRLKLILKVRLALLMHAGMTEKEVKNVIAEAPPSARLSAILTADPLKLVPA